MTHDQKLAREIKAVDMLVDAIPPEDFINSVSKVLELD